MTIDLALYQPDIANNAGTLIRLGACLGFTVHIIHPAGFPISPKTLARAGLDYVDHAAIREHASFEQFELWRAEAGRRLVLLTTKASAPVYGAEFRKGDLVMVGRESAGVPDAVAETADLRLRIPMRTGMRSINVAVSAAMVMGEAMRQVDGFTGLA